LEVGLLKLARIGHVRDIEDVLRDLRPNGPPAAAPAPSAIPSRKTSESRSRSTSPGLPGPLKDGKKPQPENPAHPPSAESEPRETPPSGFAEAFTRRVEQKSPITAVYLKKAQSVIRTESGVEVLLQNSASLTVLDTKEHREVLDSAASELVGNAVSVSLIIKEPSGAPGTPMQAAKEEPIVKKFLEVFRGDIAQVKPAKGE
jgi:hypothetical protein